MALNHQIVLELFDKCLHPNFNQKQGKAVEGITGTFYFSPEKLAEHKQEIIEQVKDLPDGFDEGWSFLQACMTKEGHQWGEHPDMERLMVLGIGVEVLEYCLPKFLWGALPGGMPYFIRKLSA